MEQPNLPHFRKDYQEGPHRKDHRGTGFCIILQILNKVTEQAEERTSSWLEAPRASIKPEEFSLNAGAIPPLHHCDTRFG